MKHNVKNLIEYARLSINHLFILKDKKKLTTTIKLLITVLILLFWLLRVDGLRLKKIIKAIGFLPWILAFCIYLMGQTVSTIRWQILCQALNYSIPFRTLWKYYLTGCFFNLFLPTSIGGDTIKAIMLGLRTGSYSGSLYTVLWDRLFGIVAMGLILIYGVAIHYRALPWLLSGTLVVSYLLFLLIYMFFPTVWRMLKAFSAVNRIGDSFIKFWQPACFVQALTVSLGFHLLWITVHLIFAKSATLNVPFTYLMIAVPVASIISMIPITIHGIGLREGALIYILGFAGIGAEESIALGILSYSIMLATGAFGGFIYILLPAETRTLSNSKINSAR